MSELTRFQPPTAPPSAIAFAVDHRARAVASLTDWAQAAQAAYGVAETLVQSSFVPAAFRGKPMEACAAILAGSEVGLSPMASLRSFDIIQGQAAPRAITLRAVAQSFGHDIEIVESTATRCIVRARRRGGEWQKVTWTMDRARDLGLTGKDPWRRQPQSMLVARATSEAARLVAADAILGIGYSAEEIADDGPAAQEPAAPPADAAPEGSRRMGRRPPPEPEPEPEPEPDDVDEHERTMITAAQQKALHASLRDAGALDRDAGLELISTIVGRPVESSKDLTKGEASHVIDSLKDGFR